MFSRCSSVTSRKTITAPPADGAMLPSSTSSRPSRAVARTRKRLASPDSTMSWPSMAPGTSSKGVPSSVRGLKSATRNGPSGRNPGMPAPGALRELYRVERAGPGRVERRPAVRGGERDAHDRRHSPDPGMELARDSFGERCAEDGLARLECLERLPVGRHLVAERLDGLACCGAHGAAAQG